MDIKNKWIYFAGPLFTASERQYNEAIASGIEQAGFAVYLPQKVCEGVISPDEIFKRCIQGIDNAWCVVAILDGADADSGTCFEVGYAYAKGIPVIGVRTDFRANADDGYLNVMIKQSVAKLCVISSLENPSNEEIVKRIKEELTALLVKVLKQD